MGQKQAAYDDSGIVVAFYDSVDSPAPEGAKVVAISDAPVSYTHLTLPTT